MKTVSFPHVPAAVLAWAVLTLSSRAGAADIDVDFRSVRYAIPDGAFGINGFKATDPDETTSSGYVEKMRYLLGEGDRSGYIRVHTWEMMQPSSEPRGWLGNDAGWDKDKVIRAVRGLTDAGFNVMLNIPAGPDGMTDVGDFAEFCAALVRIVNIEGRLGVRYFEIPNERDDILGPDDLAEYYLAAQDAMKAVDPTIMVGGPAFQHAWREADAKRFIDLTLAQLDFVSHHRYAGGGDKSDEEVWDTARTEYYSEYLREYLDQKSPGRRIPIWYDEYNVSWTWQSGQAQMRGMCGAIYDALTMSYGLDHGADYLNAWNEKDGSYGKMDDSLNLRPAAHVFHLFNAYAHGNRVASTTTAESELVPYATHDPSTGRYTVVVTNRTKSNQPLRLTLAGAPNGSFTCYRLADSQYGGCGEAGPGELSAGVTLPAQSVTVFTLEDGATAGTGGSPGTGGAPSSGGTSGTGGAPGSGGTPGTGGAPSSGGTSGTGGAPGSGGTSGAPTGGVPGSGGTTFSGGAPGSGGTSGAVSGGAAGSGGVPGAGAGGTPQAGSPAQGASAGTGSAAGDPGGTPVGTGGTAGTAGSSADSASDDAGCSCSTPRRAGSLTTAASLAGLALLLLRVRRRTLGADAVCRGR